MIYILLYLAEYSHGLFFDPENAKCVAPETSVDIYWAVRRYISEESNCRYVVYVYDLDTKNWKENIKQSPTSL
jgi:hypothetical protein